MKKILFALLFAGSIVSSSAQEMPASSPAATTIQKVGLTDVEVVYSRPSVKGRTIFGDLVPYGQVWRTGANASTKISFSTDVMIGDSKVPAGTYSFYAIPTEANWTLILNKNTTLWGSDGYSESDDVARMDVAPTMLSENVESMRISVEDLTKSSANIVLAWNNLSVAMPVSVDSESQTEKNIGKALNDANRAYRNAANYYADKKEYEKALKHIDMALALDGDSWYTNWVKAEILAESGDLKNAMKQGQKAMDMGDAYYEKAGRPFNYKANLEKSMAEWKSKK